MKTALDLNGWEIERVKWASLFPTPDWYHLWLRDAQGQKWRAAGGSLAYCAAVLYRHLG